MKKPPFLPLKTGPLGGRGGTVQAYRIPLVGYTDKLNTTDIQTVDWDYSKTIHLEMEEDHKTKEGRDEGVENHSCQIELRGARSKLVYYNGKQVLRAYSLVHVTWVLHVRSEEEYISIFHLSIYVYVPYIHTHIYIYMRARTHTHTVKYSFYILAHYW
jgi:hypothetical protein